MTLIMMMIKRDKLWPHNDESNEEVPAKRSICSIRFHLSVCDDDRDFMIVLIIMIIMIILVNYLMIIGHGFMTTITKIVKMLNYI